MPSVHLHMMEGYSPDEKKRLMQAVTNAIRFVVPAHPDAITIFLNEVPAESYARGGTQRSPAPALKDPSAIVMTFLTAMQDRDLAAAEALLSDTFKMVFPGTGEMTSLAELLDWAKPRYRFVTKTFEGIEAFQNGDCAVVYTRGTLSGEWPDGTAFSGIRFIDRFEVSDNLITRQDVWNDIAEIKGNS